MGKYPAAGARLLRRAWRAALAKIKPLRDHPELYFGSRRPPLMEAAAIAARIMKNTELHHVASRVAAGPVDKYFANGLVCHHPLYGREAREDQIELISQVQIRACYTYFGWKSAQLLGRSPPYRRFFDLHVNRRDLRSYVEYLRARQIELAFWYCNRK